MKVKSRVQLRKNVKNKMLKDLASTFGEEISGLENKTLEKITLEEYSIILVDGKPLLLEIEGHPFPTVRGALEMGLQKRVVTVDKGAVRFVSNGADIMAPGIVAADPEIKEGDLVIVVEETHKKALAIGKALMGGQEMVEATSGKAIKSITHVGDKLWKMEF
ncbi:MAG: RNA-binding protein [Methanosarcina thermophila]|uniref:RNA-binding protein, containing PUA domain n=4 Tax=Methanosarcina thermophila TaxID=2210 RepID=A0A3G9CSL0_METTE|nr:RNA-binding protein [Methanosarcina thermophila]ALK05300.1 MAG: RNA-binding protein [Methanosarcina sp. 795]AKB14078.1 tRNA-guanine(15) transglycosylase [Methanosarcina thermophila TM-1]NLU56528.1 RNA-binding protein [Methanosarcina thermophila]BAW29125.1 RNA-binding protein, containing PUA domain [Methanosarcina thermophila]GLI15471.1 RNA-binding protein [Methanosarcina thermophila MST-A1]